MEKLSRFGKWLPGRRFAMGLAAAVGVSLLLIFALLGTGPGLALVAVIASSQASSPGQQVEISGLHGVLSGRLRIARVTLSDNQGVWLSIDDAAMDWSPAALVAGRLSVERLMVERIAVARPPAPEQATGDKGGGAPLLRLDVKQIALNEIALAAPVLGVPVRLAAHGSAFLNDAPASARLRLEVERRDDMPGKVSIAASYAPDSEELALDASASEPEGGALARLLKLPDLPAIDVRLKGDGTLTDWTGALQVALNGRQEITGTAAITSAQDWRRLQARLSGRLAPFAPPHVTPLLAERSEVELDVTQAGELVRIETLSLRSATAALNARGSWRLADRHADIQIAAAIASEDTQLQIALDGETLRLGHTQLQARMVGPPERAGWRARATVARLETPDARLAELRLEASGVNADFSAPALPIDLEVSAGEVRLADEAARGFLYGPSGIRAKGDWRDGRLKLETAEVRSGFGEAVLSGSISGDARQAALELTGLLRQTRNAELARFLEAGPAEVSARLERDGESFRLSGLTVASPRANISADAEFAGERIKAEGRIAAVDLAALDARVSGRLDTAFSVAGTLAAPEVTLQAGGSEVMLLGKPFAEPKLEFAGTLSRQNPAGRLSLSGTLDGQPVRASADLTARADGPSRADNIRLVIGSARMQGDLRLGAGSLPEGNFSIDIGDLSRVAPLLLQENLDGEVKGELALEDRGGRLGARLALQSPALRFNQHKVEGLHLTAEAQDLTGAPSVTGDIEAVRIAAGTMVVEKLAVSARNAGGSTSFTATARLEGKPARLAGRMTPQGDVITIALEEGAASYRGIAAKLKAPASITIADGGARIDALALGVGGGTARISGRAGETLDLKVRLDALPASIVDTFAAGAGLSGTVSGSASVTGPAADPAVDFTAGWSGATAAALRGIGAPQLSVRAKGKYGGEQLRLDADLSGGGLKAKVAGTVGLGGAPRLDLSAKGGLPLAFLQPVLLRSGIRLDGDGRVDLTIRGTAEAPQISGRVSASDALLVETASGFALSGISAEIVLDGKTARVARLSGNVGKNGRMQASGTVDLDPGAGLQSDLALTLDDVSYSDGRTVTAALSGALTLKGSLLDMPTLGGEVNIARADITIPSRLPGSASALDVDHVNASPEVRGQFESLKERGDGDAGAEPSASIALSLTVSAPRRIYIRGRGMNAELGGSMRLTGPLSAPQALGSFELIKGRFDILTKRLAFSRGRITLTGSLDPTLDFAAQNSSGGVTTIIEISGRASNPKFGFSSVPALPEDEVMARFFFDESLASLSPVQLAQLAGALATLTGATSGPGVMDRIRNLLGVDTLDFSAGADGKTPQVSAGRYITDSAYVGVKQGAEMDSSAVTTNIDLTDTLKLKGEIDAQGKTKAGIFVEKDY